MTLIAQVYTDQDRIERLLSRCGVVSFSDHNREGDPDDGVVDDCINRAAQETELFATQRYAQAGLVNSPLFVEWNTLVAAYFLCYRRGNPVPESLQFEFDRIMDVENGLLAKVAKGKLQLPGVPLKADLRPTFSNLKVDRRYRQSKVRVTTNNSSNAPTKLTQDEAWDWWYYGGGMYE